MKRLLIVIAALTLLLSACQTSQTDNGTMTEQITNQATGNITPAIDETPTPTDTPQPTPTRVPTPEPATAESALDNSIFTLPAVIMDESYGTITLKNVFSNHLNQIVLEVTFENKLNRQQIFAITSASFNHCVLYPASNEIIMEPKLTKTDKIIIPFAALQKYNIENITDLELTYRVLNMPMTTEKKSGSYKVESSASQQPIERTGEKPVYTDDNLDIYLNELDKLYGYGDEYFIFHINNKTDKAYEFLLQAVAVNGICKAEEIYFYMPANSTLLLQNPRKVYKFAQYFKFTESAATLQANLSMRELGQTRKKTHITTDVYTLDSNVEVIHPEPFGDVIYSKYNVKIYAGDIEYLKMSNMNRYVLNLYFENNSDYTYRAGMIDFLINGQADIGHYMVTLPNSVCFTPIIIEDEDIEILDNNTVSIRFNMELMGRTSFNTLIRFEVECKVFKE